MESARTIKFKALLLESFFKLLEEKEFKKIGISDICKGANVSRQGFYLHYKNVEDMLITELTTRFARASKNLDNSMDFSEIIRVTYDFSYEHQDSIRLFFNPQIEHITKPVFRKMFDDFSFNFFFERSALNRGKFFEYDFIIRINIFFTVFEKLLDNKFDISVDEVIEIIIPYYKVGDYDNDGKIIV